MLMKTEWFSEDTFLSTTCCMDVDPKLITYQSQDVASALDRCLLPAEWISSASWNPSIRVLNTASSAGHKILRISMQLRPSVVNNPKDPKHEVLPSDLFMPGKHPNAAKQSDIQALVRLLHRETQLDNRCTPWYQSLAFARQSLQIEDGLNRSHGLKLEWPSNRWHIDNLPIEVPSSYRCKVWETKWIFSSFAAGMPECSFNKYWDQHDVLRTYICSVP